MSRRDKLSGIFADELVDNRVLAGPVRTMGLTLDRMDHEARVLKEALKSGEVIVELDPLLIDESFVQDRLDVDLTMDDELVRSIDENGQTIPILVRLHPEIEGRFQVAYGHRRLQALRLLQRNVKAVVKPLTDDELVIAQGVENAARKDLSYIERAMFASRLEERGFERPIIMQALNTDKTELSKLLSVARAIPSKLVISIGTAPDTGRRKWLELAQYSSEQGAVVAAMRATEHQGFAALTSDERFASVFKAMSGSKSVKAEVATWKPVDGRVSGKIKDTGISYSLILKAPEADGFGSYLTNRLDELYADWMKTRDGE